MVNANEDEYREAIDELMAYRIKLLEIAETMQSAVKQTSVNLQGDDNVRSINDRINRYVVMIHDEAGKVHRLAINLSNELENIKRAHSELENS